MRLLDWYRRLFGRPPDPEYIITEVTYGDGEKVFRVYRYGKPVVFDLPSLSGPRYEQSWRTLEGAQGAIERDRLGRRATETQRLAETIVSEKRVSEVRRKR